MTEYIICYDICQPKRLVRIHRALQRQAVALQYSVFLFSGTLIQLQRCLNELESLMDKRRDDIRAYPLPQRGLRFRLGKSLLPGGIQWSGLPQPWRDVPS
jgi:CRISPR-associated protein Cas2